MTANPPPIVASQSAIPNVRVSVAICTWNRCQLLRQTLQSMTRLEIPSGTTWEIIVVNNDSPDATDDVVAEFKAILPIRVVFEARAGLSNARNRAIAECRGDYLVFTDDDVNVTPQWLAAFVAAVRAYPSAGAFGGPVAPWFPVAPDPQLLAAFPAIRNGFCGLDHHRPLGVLPSQFRVTGANMAFHVPALSDLTFDPALGVNKNSLGGGEETAFVSTLRRHGADVIWVPEMKVSHYVDPSRMELHYLIKLARDRGRSKIREKGIPPGTRLAGAPARFWYNWLTASGRAASAYLSGHRIRAAGHFAKAESHRAKISECRALRRGRS